MILVVIAFSLFGVAVAEDGKVSLFGGTDANSGIVQIEFGNQQGTVCNVDWNVYAADVVCKEVLNTTSKATARFAPPEGSTLKVFLDRVECRGDEGNLMSCVHGELGQSTCEVDNSAGVICWPPTEYQDPSRTNGMVRLSGGLTSKEGRVETFIGGSWGSVCDEKWDANDAVVICKQLGCTNGLEASTGSKYGPGVLDIKLTDVQCQGTEKEFKDCQFLVISPDENTTCTHETEAGAKCDCGLTVKVGEENTGDGVVQVKPSGESEGALCHDDFNMRTGDVVCREAGFRGAMSVSAVDTSAVLLDVSYACDGTEISLKACTESSFNASQCTGGQAAAVVCQKNDDTEPSEEPTSTTVAPDSGLGTGAIVGIVIGVLVAVVIIIVIGCCLCRTRKSDRPAAI